MPAVMLASRPEFGYVRAQNGADIGGLIAELRSRQNDMGAYKLWPGGDTIVEFVSLYAQHLLLEAGERNQPIPGDLLASGNNYLRHVATRDGNNLTDERAFLALDQERGTRARIGYLTNQPRTFGTSLRVNF